MRLSSEYCIRSYEFQIKKNSYFLLSTVFQGLELYIGISNTTSASALKNVCSDLNTPLCLKLIKNQLTIFTDAMIVNITKMTNRDISFSRELMIGNVIRFWYPVSIMLRNRHSSVITQTKYYNILCNISVGHIHVRESITILYSYPFLQISYICNTLITNKKKYCLMVFSYS